MKTVVHNGTVLRQNTGTRAERKVEQILNGATKVFMEQGFEGASVDEIAAAARVSKATLYSYFPDKRELFRHVIATECARQANQAFDLSGMTDPPEVVLKRAATHLMTFLLSPFGQQIYRLCIAEAVRFPDLGRAFYDSGPALAQQRLKCYLRHSVQNGRLHIADDEIEVASDQFAQLCKSDLFYRMILGLENTASGKDIELAADQTVDLFMSKYRPGAKPELQKRAGTGPAP
ncbi:MAG: TetR/AcrR family transcriptional regulator [Pseudomonadota bacterium]